MSLTIDPVNNGSLSSKVLESPSKINTKTSAGTKIVNFRGTLYSATPSSAHALREDLLQIVNDNQRVNIAYSAESGYDGSYFVTSSSVDSVKIGSGFYDYRIDATYVGASQ